MGVYKIWPETQPDAPRDDATIDQKIGVVELDNIIHQTTIAGLRLRVKREASYLLYISLRSITIVAKIITKKLFTKKMF